MAGAELIEPGYHMENGQAKNQIEIKKENNQNNISSIERERERERERGREMIETIITTIIIIPP